MRKYSAFQKCLAWMLTLVLVVGLLPSVALSLPASSVPRTADDATINAWEPLFVDPDAAGVDLTTENAGGIWTDKSVFVPGDVPADWTSAGVRIADKDDNFLVALSAVASNKEITGYSTIPTDTVFVLDLSSSMQTNDDRGQSAIDELVVATNKAITDLLALNKNNRVGVVLYAGNTSKEFNDNQGITTVVMPIDRYTTTQSGKYLEAYSNNLSIRVFNGVRNSDNRTPSGSLESARGTFTQDGIYEAMKMFRAQDTEVTEGVQAGTDRMPIMVLMTDGEPTMANNVYNGNNGRTDLGTSNMYLRFNGQDYNHRYTIAFMTQLTAAFAKREVSRHYGTEARLYTLAYGEEVTRLPEALAVMDPAQDTVLNDFWADFLDNEQVTVFTTRSGNRPNSYTYSYLYAQNDTTDPLTAADKLYTTEYFPADTDDQLAEAFESIVDEIILQSKYYPTYVERDHDHDGYITFADKIGGYMEVAEMKGILIGDNFYSGAAMAQKLTDGSLGTVDNPTSLGDNFVWSVKERLGITETSIARQLLQNAFDKGQLSYDTATGAYSNYIGWYSDEDGNYLDFWYDGITTAPPAGATHIIKSYGVLGQTDPDHGISAEDMLYASIRVSKEINDYDNDGIVGETIVTWQIPASLIPTITYQVEVDVDADGNITDVLNVTLESDEVTPIRLLYEVALQEDIHDWNLAEKVSQGYYNSTDNKDAGYVFYTNQWNKAGENPQQQTSRNTYSHFEPSVQNERYYYTQDTVIYEKNGDDYTAVTTQPSSGGTYYRQYPVYEALTNGRFRIHYHYEQISAAALAAENLEQNDAGQWMVKKGVVHRYYNDYQFEKGANDHTDTMDYYFYPMIEVLQDSHYYSTVTLGNNGKLTVTPATGIKVTKNVSETADGAPDDTFDFIISGGNNSTATLILLDENGNEASRSDLTFTGAGAEFTIRDGETVYIIGLTAGDTYTIYEESNTHYSVSSVKVNGTTVSGTEAVVQMVDQTIQSAEFTNSPKSYGNLFITKEIISEHTIPASIRAAEFEVQVNVGATLAGEDYTVRSSQGSDVTAVVDASGYLKVEGQNLSIVDGQSYEIVGLPEGTVVTVEEVLTSAQGEIFTSAIKTRDHTGAAQEDNNTVTIFKDANGTANIINTYDLDPISVNLNIKGTKTFKWDAPLDITFQFQVQQWDGQDWVDITGKTASVEYYTSSTEKETSFQIADVLAGVEFDKVGTYTYQIVEVVPRDEDKVPGVAYDRSTHTFTVIVTDKGGELEAKVATHQVELTPNPNDGVFTVEPKFVNEYNTAPVSIDVKKTVTNTAGTAEINAAGFGITAVRTDTNGQPLTNEDAASLTEITDGAGEVRFIGSFKEIGDYYFVVSEEIPAGAQRVEDTESPYYGMYFLDGWYFDATEYLVHFNVAYKDGSSTDLTATETVTVLGSDTALSSDVLAFTNIYKPTQAAVNLNQTVLKHLEGRDLEAGEFTFYVYNNGDRTTWLLKGTNDASGNVAFVDTDDTTDVDVLTFDTVGVYHYDVVEQEGSLGGVTYDETVYDMVIVVEDNDLNDGQLTAYYYFEDSVSQQVTFHNTYKAADTQLVLGGTKKLSGRNIINAEFRFSLTQVTNADGNTAVENGLSMVAENGPRLAGDGNTAGFAFDKITYTSDDAGKEFFYRIEEINSGDTILGVTHNTEKVYYVVKVTVTDNGDGTLTAAPETVKVTVSDNGDGTSTETRETIGSDAILFKNVYIPQGTSARLPGTKELTGRVLSDGEFTFTLTEKTDNTYAADKDGGERQTVQNAADGTITFDEITFGTVGNYYYVVEEQGGSLGGITYDDTKYHVHIEVKDNGLGHLVTTTHITMLITPEGGETITMPTGGIEFHNIYGQQDGQLVISGTKELLGGKMLTDGEFTFELYEGDTLLDSVEIQGGNSNTASFEFDAITYTAEDVDKTFTYVVKEKIPTDAVDNEDGTWTKGQYIYDGTEFTVQVTVKDDVKDGILEITKTVNGSETEEITFTNTFVPNPVTYAIQVNKEYDKSLSGNEFTFVLKSADGKLGVYQEKKNNASGEVFFDEIPFPEEGFYTFTVEEIDKTLSYVDYSSAVYKVTIRLVNNNGVLSVEEPITVEKTSGIAEENNLVFINRYNMVGEGEVTLQGTKTVTGDRDTFEAGEFQFGLYDEDDNLLEVVTNDEDGNFAFSPLYFDQDHTTIDGENVYLYTVKEIPGAYARYTYDGTVYLVAVTVKDNDQGGIAVSYTVDGVENGEITFENVYSDPEPVSYAPAAVKNYNKPLAGGEFTFKLEGEIAGQQIAQTKKNLVDGAVEFDTLYFPEAGTYTFTVKEINKVLGFIQYAAEEYELIVDVVDVDGVLYLNTVTVDGEIDGTMEFTNIYQMAGEGLVTLEGTKTVTGDRDTFEAGEFQFGLYDEERNLLEIVTNDENGNFAFTPLLFNESHTIVSGGALYVYTVEEIPGDNARYQYDDTVYTVEIFVWDNGQGGVDVSYAIDGVEDGEITFENVYSDPEPVPYAPAAVKNYNKPLAGGEFTFKLEGEIAGQQIAQTKKNLAGGLVEFDPLYFPEAGTYTFTVKEIEKALGFVQYAKEEYELIVEVMSVQGELMLGAITVNGKEDGTIEFTNVYQMAGKGEVILQGTKVLTGDRDTVKAGEFQFGLYDKDGKLVETVKNNADGTFRFTALKFGEGHTTVGGQTKYTYTVKEIAGDNARYQYDDAVYTVEIFVGDNDQGSIYINVSYRVDGVETGDIIFENVYTDPAPVTYAPEAQKHYNKPLAGGEFTFKLEGEIAGQKVEQTKKNLEDGAVKFDALSFPEAGMYTFTVKEIEKVLGFVQYAKEEYELTVEVVDTKGVLSIGEVTVDGKKDGTLEFTNTYQMDGEGVVVLQGIKTVIGDRNSVKADEFQFGLYDEDGKLVEAVKNSVDGSFRFTALKFDESHTTVGGQTKYTYTVKEIAGDDPYITYDDKVYEVVVTVKDNGEGGITVSHTVDGAADGAIAFENVFTEPDPAMVLIDVTKIVENKTQPGITAEDFEILIYEGDVQRSSAKTGATGKAGFQIAYTLEDVGKTVTYRVMEKQGKAVGVTYDETVYEIQIAVAAKEDGTLYTVINGQEIDSVEVIFTNIYEAPTTPVTGDTAPIVLAGSLMLVSLAAIVVLLMSKKRKGGKYAA